MICVLIKDNIVVNRIIVGDSDDLNKYKGDSDLIIEEPGAQIGWVYDNGSFIPPEIPDFTE